MLSIIVGWSLAAVGLAACWSVLCWRGSIRVKVYPVDDGWRVLVRDDKGYIAKSFGSEPSEDEITQVVDLFQLWKAGR